MMCKKLEGRLLMATNLAINQELLHEALEVSGLKTKKDTVNLALKEFIDRRKQLEILKLFGKMDPDPDYDYKKGRNR
jgi:Arc/MetJ family transcription regulator